VLVYSGSISRRVVPGYPNEPASFRDRVNGYNLVIQAGKEHRTMLPENSDVENWVETLSTEELERLHKLVLFEPGTQVYRRQRFAELLESELKRSRRNTRCLSLALVRVENFNELAHNDGLSVISARMKQVALSLKRYLREADLPVRYASDGFAIIMPEAAVVGANTALMRICDRILDDQPPSHIAPALNLSFGVATFPVDSREPMELEWKAKQVISPHVPSRMKSAPDKTARDQVLTDIAWHLIGGTENWDSHCAQLMRDHDISTDEVRKACIELME
jgi:diguanylate cyclase (GGDEF)-like protein